MNLNSGQRLFTQNDAILRMIRTKCGSVLLSDVILRMVPTDLRVDTREGSRVQDSAFKFTIQDRSPEDSHMDLRASILNRELER